MVYTFIFLLVCEDSDYLAFMPALMGCIMGPPAVPGDGHKRSDLSIFVEFLSELEYLWAWYFNTSDSHLPPAESLGI